LTVTIALRALAIALLRHPQVNASWRDGAIEYHADVNIGIAVAVGERPGRAGSASRPDADAG
jgi:pyruvate/2-oxoglutarate dehydrogenase complex dihydrolipoamide acyltransferase (E2) component